MAWKLLFGSDVGLFSLITIVVIIAIGAYMYVFVRRKMAEEESDQPRSGKAAGRRNKEGQTHGQAADLDDFETGSAARVSPNRRLIKLNIQKSFTQACAWTMSRKVLQMG